MSARRRRALALTGALALAGAALGPLVWQSSTSRAEEWVELDPATIDMRNGGVPAMIDWVRYEMIVVTGPMGGYRLAPHRGPQRGFIGDIDYLTGGDVIGSILAADGIASCADIPTTGEVSRTIEEDGEQVPVSCAFEPGSVLRPALYGGTGETYAKRLVFKEEGVANFVVELTCPDVAGHTSVYLLRPAMGRNESGQEVHFDRDEATGETRVDVAVKSSSTGEHFVFRFHYADGLAQFWKVRAMVGSTDQWSSGVAAMVDVNEAVAHVRFLPRGVGPDDTTTFAEPTEMYCVDLEADAATERCDELGLAVRDPGMTLPIGGATHAFHYAGIASIEVPGL